MKIKDLFKRKKRSTVRVVTSESEFNDLVYEGSYTKLSNNPEVRMAVDKIADLVSNMTIHLMENTEKGDKRLKNNLSRKIDIEPHLNMTRKSWVYKIVSDLLLYGDGNSICHISINRETGLIDNLTPFQMVGVTYEDLKKGYKIHYNDKDYNPDELIHFVLNPDPNYPYKGTGYRVVMRDIVNNLQQATKTKSAFMSGKYMPNLIIKADGLTEEFQTPEGRQKLLDKYLSETKQGQPWIIPADLLEVEQIKPLSLKDIAINESVELDKKTIAGLLGVPAFFVGVGDFNKEEYNNFINTKIMSIGNIISQTLTRDVLYNPDWYFKMNPRSLYSYNLTELVSAGSEMAKINAMRRNELRDWVGLDPDEEMEQLLVLENFIKEEDVGNQNKLNGGTDT
ncbi:MAG: phage portal protein [Tetragenococcus halophilus]|nr:phage portal protein [Tetragenococcus halophilus]